MTRIRFTLLSSLCLLITRVRAADPGYQYFVNGLSRATDELIFFRLGLGSDEREQRGAIRRGNQNKAAMLPKVVINDQTESKLVQVESKASILIANEDGNMVKTEVRVLSIQAKRRPVRPRR